MGSDRKPDLWRPAPVSMIQDAASLPWTRLHPAPELVGYLWAFDRAAGGDPPTRRETEVAMGWGSTRAGRVLDEVANRLASWNGRSPETATTALPNQPQTGREPDINHSQTSRKPGSNHSTPANIDIVDEPQTGREPAANRPASTLKPAANQPQTSAPRNTALPRGFGTPLQEQEQRSQLQDNTNRASTISVVEDRDQTKEISRPSTIGRLGEGGLGEEPRPHPTTPPPPRLVEPNPATNLRSPARGAAPTPTQPRTPSPAPTPQEPLRPLPTPPAEPAGPPDAVASVSPRPAPRRPLGLFSHPEPAEPDSRAASGPTGAPGSDAAPLALREVGGANEAPGAGYAGVTFGVGVKPSEVPAAAVRVFVNWRDRQVSPGRCALTAARVKLLNQALKRVGEAGLVRLLAFAYEAPDAALGNFRHAWREECGGKPDLEMLLRGEKVERNVEMAGKWDPRSADRTSGSGGGGKAEAILRGLGAAVNGGREET